MSRICELTGKGRQVGHNVSHANNKTKRVFLPNLQNVTLMSETLEKSVKLRVSTHGLRSVEHNGGLDNWLLKTRDDKLSLRARRLKAGDREEEGSRRRLIRAKCEIREAAPSGPLFVSLELFGQRELEQQRALEKQVIIVRYHP